MIKNMLGPALAMLFATAIPAAAQCRLSSARQGGWVTYRFEPETASGSLLHVTVEFQIGVSGTEPIVVPARWADETLHAITNLRSMSNDVVLSEGARDDMRIVRGPTGKTAILTYDLIKDWTGPLTNQQFHPVMMPEYFEFTTDNALVHPDFTDSQSVTVNYDWQKLPASWTVATSFGTSNSGKERCQTHSGPWADASNALFAAGDFRVYRFKIDGRPAVLAVRGEWLFTDDEAIRDVQKAVGIVRDFWHDHNFPYFLVTLKPYDSDHGNSDGSAFTNAFWIYMSRLDTFPSVSTTLVHETFHLWNPLRMGSLSSDQRPATRWLWEGFTRYYGNRLAYDAGMLSVQQYIDSLNRDLRRFPVSDDSGLRGHVIALWLDAAIRRETLGMRSLDNVMFDLVRGHKQPMTLARVFDSIDRYLPQRLQPEFRRAVLNHGDLAPPESAPVIGSCSSVSIETLPTFDLGFDVNASRAATIITGVEPEGPAFAAGLRDGQALKGISYNYDEPDRPATITIRSNAEDQKVTYLPKGKPLTLPQYHPVLKNNCR
jgi:predicted metalloprotease with PDZ domain